MSPVKEQHTPSANPETPRRSSSSAKNRNATTSAKKRSPAQAGATPKSAPAAAGHSSSHRKKPEPTLLTDFLLGRPSPARVAAQREAAKQRRKSMADAAHVREELRQEMRAAAVRRLQQPGGVRERVKAWQKANAIAMMEIGGGVPHAEDVATEPTEVAVQVSPESVTEEDRVRIRSRQQRPKKKKSRPEKAGVEVEAHDESEGRAEGKSERKAEGETKEKEKQDARDNRDSEREESAGTRSGTPSQEPPAVKAAPKKRIVSDDNWMKRGKGRSPPRSGLPRPKVEKGPRPIPKDFLQRTAQNPSVQSKIRDWAERVEMPEPPRPKQPRPRRSAPAVAAEGDVPSVGTSDPEVTAAPRAPPDDGIRVRPVKPKRTKSESGDELPADDGVGVKPTRPRKPKAECDDGIRITPVRKKASADDGIRVRPIETKLPDDGIRVRPINSPLSGDDIRIRPGRKTPVDDAPVSPASSRSTSVDRNARIRSMRRAPSRDNVIEVIEVIEEPETEVETPVKRKVSRRRSRRRDRSPSPIVRTAEPQEHRTSRHEKAPRIPPPHDTSDDESERMPPTVMGNKSLAEIPFGHSAFSELDLPLGAEARTSHRKPKAQRNPSFKTMPKVLKKVVTGAKEIIHERAEPPRPPVTNKPRSIESWLNDTVDPFVEQVPKPEAADGEPVPEPPIPAPESQERPATKSPSENRQREPVAAAAPRKALSQDVEEQEEDSDVTPKRAKSPVTPANPSTGLKRRRATRMTSSPAKSGGKKPFRDLLKDAFKGESDGHKFPPTVYPSCEADSDRETDCDDDDWESTDERRRSTSPSKRSPSPDHSSAYDSVLSSDISSNDTRRRTPPTNGAHRLSTIPSENSNSAFGSETISDVSQTTVTQTTAFTKPTELARQKSQRPGLKRRLTRHSDLVSVLSQPDDGQLVPPSRSRSAKSSRSLHRKPSKADRSKADDLLDEFADDEHIYGRELKTLVDGVIPVLLRDVMNGEVKGARTEATARSVVNMGVVLEKLRDFHRRVPLGDIGGLLCWLEEVSPVYDNYLDVWRLGFQGLIINLAPKNGRLNDDDSLLNALPLNEDGDIVGENGERVDVAFLLKRPLIRIKWIVKFLRAAVAVTGTSEAERLLAVFQSLQEKARKRHREESARMMDEDANNTDTSRCRDLRNLLPLDGVLMNRTRQVAALDVFSLDLNHSSGQRLACQVELIHRDNPAVPGDKGDILIREIGNGTQSWLLFPPVPKQHISARRSDEDQALIVMIRGTHNGNEWFELLKLSTTSEEQITYWLDVLGSNPMPPATRKRPTSMVLESTSPKSDGADIPVGERKLSAPARGSLEAGRPNTPTRYRTRQYDGPSTPPSPSQAYVARVSPDQTPARDSHDQARPDKDRGLYSLRTPPYEAPRVIRPPPNSTPYREDGAPPPPIHRTLGPRSSGMLAPPVDFAPHTRLKRRMSSPLKHEYRPSDVSSESSCSVSEDDSGSSQSSSDELDEDEVPDTIPGYSIKGDAAPPAESVVSDGNSISPSNSASQVEAKGQGNAKPERPAQKFVASVSYWSSRRGVWKDINGGQPASIVVHPGCMEVHRLDEQHSDRKAYPLQSSSSGTSEAGNTSKDAGSSPPLVMLVLTPVVMIRRSTALDLEVRSPASRESRLKIEAGMFRFRAATQTEAKDLYEAVHVSRLNNARYIQLSEEARVRSFGQMQAVPGDGSVDDDSSSRRRGWFGRKNSYRASARAPSVSQGSMSTTVSASSFLRRLLGGGNTSFNIDESSVDRQSRPGSAAAGGDSLYTSGSSGSGSRSGSGSGSSTPPRSLSLSLSGSGSRWSNGLAKPFSPDQPLEIRCHINVHNNRWQDKGNCVLHISRPPPGVRQELPLYHGLEKRVVVTHATKKAGDQPLILLDAVLGSKCFSMLGTRGIMCSVWENLRDEEGNVGVAPSRGATAGKITKWCFQCKSVQQAHWIMGLLTSEVPGLMIG